MIHTFLIPDDIDEIRFHVSPFGFVVMHNHLGNDRISGPDRRCTKVTVWAVLEPHRRKLVDDDG